MAEQKSHYVEIREEEIDLIKDEKLFLEELLRILDTPSPKSQSEQEQKKEHYENTKGMLEAEHKVCGRVEKPEGGSASNVEEFKRGSSQVEAQKEVSDADKLHRELDKDRTKLLQKELKKEIKLHKEIEKKLDNQTNQRQILAEKLRMEKMQRERKERKLMNEIKRCESLERKLKCERRTNEYYEEITRKEPKQEYLKKVICQRTKGQQKLIPDIKLTEHLRNDEGTGMLNYTAKEKLKAMLECTVQLGEEEHEAGNTGLEKAKPRQTEVTSETENGEETETQQDSPKAVSSNYCRHSVIIVVKNYITSHSLAPKLVKWNKS
jgi:hypothetical protein